jgi:Cu/Zn superoxide dismutase
MALLSRMARLFVAVGCEIAYNHGASASQAFASLGTYPGYAGSLSISGSAYVVDSADGIYMEATLYGLEPSTTAGFHIHAGYSCVEAEDVGGHYFVNSDDDPWSTTYTSDANGRATVKLSMSGFSLNDELPVSGRTVVVHSSDTKIGCGLLEPTVGEVVTVGHYPGFSGSEQVNGTVLISPNADDTGVLIFGTLIGVEPSVTAGIHIHNGFVRVVVALCRPGLLLQLLLTPCIALLCVKVLVRLARWGWRPLLRRCRARPVDDNVHFRHERIDYCQLDDARLLDAQRDARFVSHARSAYDDLQSRLWGYRCARQGIRVDRRISWILW